MGALLPERPNPKYKGVDALRQIFLNPPREARPRGYWVWPHGNFDYSTIRKELEAYKAKGLGGVDIFDLGVRDSKDVIPPGPGFMSVGAGRRHRLRASSRPSGWTWTWV